MTHFVAYHSRSRMGYGYDADGAIDVGDDHRFFTKRPYRPETLLGTRLWAIESRGSPMRYWLVGTGLIEDPPVRAKGRTTVTARCDVKLPHMDVSDEPWFKVLFQEQNRFSYGLSRIRADRVIRSLERIREENAKVTGRKRSSPPPSTGSTGATTRALSLRQPWAELIMRGEKKIEYRSFRTHLRERVYIYAGEGRYPRDEEAAWGEEYSLDMDSLPRGVVVGTVEIVDCTPSRKHDGFEWHLARPERGKRLRRPTKHPQPGFFYPF